MRQESPCCRHGRHRWWVPRSLGGAGGLWTVCAPVPPVCPHGARKRGAWPRPCPLDREPCGGRGQTRPRLPSACESARCVIMLVLWEAGGRDRMSGPPARTLKRTPQCRGWGGGVGTELGHVGGGFVGISAPWEEAEGAHSRLCGLPGGHTAGTVVCSREGPLPNTGRPAPCDLEPPVLGLRGCGAQPPWALCHTPGPLRASPGRRSRPPPAPAARRAPPLRFFPDVGTASASTTV